MKKIEFKVMVWLRSIREKHAAELKDKSVEERVAYYRRKAQTVRSKPPQEKVVA
jgi:hypothetical protein